MLKLDLDLLDHPTELESQNDINQDYFYSGSPAAVADVTLGFARLLMGNRVILTSCQHLNM